MAVMGSQQNTAPILINGPTMGEGEGREAWCASVPGLTKSWT